MQITLSAAQARRVAITAQGLGRRTPGARLPGVLERMGTVQIDSVNVFARSHYMPFLARVGPYDTARLDRMLFSPGAGFTEVWAHCAALVPSRDWPLWRFRMQEHAQRRTLPADSWFQNNLGTVEWVRAELAARGPLRPAEIEADAVRERGRRGPWWDWDAVKLALEHLWRSGEVAIAGRRGFERRYGLVPHVLPEVAEAPPVPRPDAIRELIARAARASGVATESDLDDYWRIGDRGASRRAIAELVDEGVLLPARVEGWERGGRPLPAWLHRDAVRARRTATDALLTPFDPLVWFRERSERLFDFHYRIEIYTPSARRRYGYYSLPVLLGDRIAGRVDLKADRASSRLRVQSAWWEPGVDAADAAPRLALLLEEAARWQGLEEISLSGWGDAVDDLRRVLPGARRHDAGPTPASAEG